MPFRIIAIYFLFGVVAGHLIARLLRNAAARRVLGVVLAIATLLTLIAGLQTYEVELRDALFISRFEMAALGCDVLFSALAIGSAVVDAGKNSGWIPPRAIRFRHQELLNAPLAAFIAGMLVYLIAYPPVAWALMILVLLTMALGVVLTLPFPAADAPRMTALLQGICGLAAAFGASVAGGLAFIMLGGFMAAAGFSLARARDASQPSVFALFGIAFGTRRAEYGA